MKDEILHRIYLHGHYGKSLPRWFRKIAVRTQFHRAWLSGFNGNFWEAGEHYGPANPYAKRFEKLACDDDWDALAERRKKEYNK